MSGNISALCISVAASACFSTYGSAALPVCCTYVPVLMAHILDAAMAKYGKASTLQTLDSPTCIAKSEDMIEEPISLSTIHILTKINHKALERMWKILAFLRKHFVEAKEKEIQFGKGGRWQDIGADEATFDKMNRSLAHWGTMGGHCYPQLPGVLGLDPLEATSYHVPGTRSRCYSQSIGNQLLRNGSKIERWSSMQIAQVRTRPKCQAFCTTL